MNVGVRQLKNSLSRYLRAVRQGEVILVTERGSVIAELRPRPGDASDEDAALAELELRGVLTRGQGRLTAAEPVKVRGRKRASSMVIEDRG
jgi:prevent-host-death family protein